MELNHSTKHTEEFKLPTVSFQVIGSETDLNPLAQITALPLISRIAHTSINLTDLYSEWLTQNKNIGPKIIEFIKSIPEMLEVSGAVLFTHDQSCELPDKESRAEFGQFLIMAVGNYLGFPRGQEGQRNGDVVQKLISLKQFATSQTGNSSKVELSGHIEDGHLGELRPAFIVLHCIRGHDEAHTVLTTFNENDLTHETLHLLKNSIIKISPDDSIQGGEPYVTTVINTKGEIIYDPAFTTTYDQSLIKAVEELNSLLKRNAEYITLNAGDLLVFSNKDSRFNIVHARTSFTPDFETPRFVLRVCVYDEDIQTEASEGVKHNREELLSFFKSKGVITYSENGFDGKNGSYTIETDILPCLRNHEKLIETARLIYHSLTEEQRNVDCFVGVPETGTLIVNYLNFIHHEVTGRDIPILPLRSATKEYQDKRGTAHSVVPLDKNFKITLIEDDTVTGNSVVDALKHLVLAQGDSGMIEKLNIVSIFSRPGSLEHIAEEAKQIPNLTQNISIGSIYKVEELSI